MEKDFLVGLIGTQESMTNSYKYLFFVAIIEILERNNFSITTIHFGELAKKMLEIAWQPILHYELDFGPQDKIKTILKKRVVEGSNLFELASAKKISKEISKIPYKEYSEILRYVPQRMLSGFFHNQLRGKRDGEKDLMIIQLSQQDTKGLYAIHRKGTMYPEPNSIIILNKPWIDYIQMNRPILTGWLDRNWLDYLESRNPGMPGISKKIKLGSRKRNLSKQRKLWKEVMGARELKCIYSDSILTKNQFALDHFIPEKFIAHNELWNLIPTHKYKDDRKSPNTSKNKILPHTKYIDKMVDIQFEFIEFHSDKSEKKYENILLDYKRTLKLSSNEIRNKKIFKDAMQSEIEKTIRLAESHGFQSGWSYKLTNIKET